MSASPYDICTCGDYRRDHEGGTGRCTLPADAVHGFRACTRFQLATASRAVRHG
jgi:hypothetical protein